MTCTDHESSFICEHWRDHQEALSEALASDMPAEVGTVHASISWV